jgi:hypothetical protein
MVEQQKKTNSTETQARRTENAFFRSDTGRDAGQTERKPYVAEKERHREVRLLKKARVSDLRNELNSSRRFAGWLGRGLLYLGMYSSSIG